jgi:hypothetical protein
MAKVVESSTRLTLKFSFFEKIFGFKSGISVDKDLLINLISHLKLPTSLSTLLMVVVIGLTNTQPVYAHQPVDLGSKNITADQGPILSDATVSFAVRANFTKANQTRGFRAVLKASELLNFEYLIIDKAPENRYAMNKLPTATITYPSGKKTVVKLNERSKFFERYTGTNYLYLGRFSDTAESGIYKINIRSKGVAKITVAIGRKEIPGEVLPAATCPINRAAGDITLGEAATLVGMSKSVATSCATKLNWQFRVGAEDDQQFAVTKDYRLDRVIVTIKNNLITQSIPG